MKEELLLPLKHSFFLIIIIKHVLKTIMFSPNKSKPLKPTIQNQ
jgi:hypothetical protein